MILKILYNDFIKNKVITLTLFAFMSLSVFLVLAGVNMVLNLHAALEYLFTRADIPHYVQLYDGPLNPSVLNNWIKSNPHVKKIQIVDMLKINGDYVFLGQSDHAESNTVMNLYFVEQNKDFDFLPTVNDKIIYPKKGEIEVPIYFMQHYHLKLGEKVYISTSVFKKKYTIVGFVRDVQMNPAFVHSKRFVVNPSDLIQMQGHVGKKVYLIEFQLKNLGLLSAFNHDYQKTIFAKNGPILDYHLYKFLNAITDGLVIGTIILIGALLALIALLCLRFIIYATIEEDFRQISILKAIGISPYEIKKIYLFRYVFLMLLVSIFSYFLAHWLDHLLLANMSLYLGVPPPTSALKFVSFVVIGLIFSFVIAFCALVFRKIDRITAVDALRQAGLTDFKKHWVQLDIKNYRLNLNMFLGLRDVFQKVSLYVFPFFVFFICAFLIILPVNFYNTVNSENFITYMGIGRSDIRIDLSSSDSSERIMSRIKKDPDVSRYALMTIGRFEVLMNKNQRERINIETGDFSIFPVKYMKGQAPVKNNEISLSYLSSKDFNVSVGSYLTVITDEGQKKLLVTGVYQDITNGGHTAKAKLPVKAQDKFWQVINFDLKPKVNIENKVSEYNRDFSPIKVAFLNDYLTQTLGDLITHVKFVSLSAILISMMIAVLISTLFLKMLLLKQRSEIAIMKLLGFNAGDVFIQYLTRALLVLNGGVLLGTFFANSFGQSVVGFFWSFMGAPEVQFIIKPYEVYLLCPLLLLMVVTVSAIANTITIKAINITQMMTE